VVRILAGGLEAKARRAGAPYTVIYTAENHNRAAEILADGLRPHLSAAARGRFECLNTVIGKMSGVVTGRAEIEAQGLVPIAPGLPRAFLVETFNRILISGIRRRDFQRGITVFEEQPDLRPFEEAKLYGHNAVHALLGFLLRARGRRLMAEAADEPDLLTLAREAFTEESGGALCRKFTGVAPLFTRSGYAAYADDLLRRMLNPHLRDSVARVTRDPRRKLGWHDRLIGTMRVALSQGIRPVRFARGAAAALRTLAEEARSDADRLLATLWEDEDANPVEKAQITELVAATGVRT
jgi:mannitol-1-phosphate 5-dehydrogenase